MFYHTSENAADDKYRFYLCKEHTTHVNYYECIQIQAKEINPALLEKGSRDVLVPIRKGWPHAMDFMFINSALKPTFNIIK